MALTESFINQLRDTAIVAHRVKIETLVVDNDSIRGIDEDRRVVLIQPIGDIDLPFNMLGIGRVKAFIDRMNIIYNGDDRNFDIIIDGDNKNVTSLKMKNKSTSIDFGCINNPEHLKIPKGINDEVAFNITLNGDTVKTIRSSFNAMKSIKTKICYKKEELYFETEDFNGDILKHVIDGDVHKHGEITEFEHKYITKLLVSLLTNEENIVSIGGRGSLNVNHNGVNMYILPQV